jgi:hypothetical protein
MVRAREGEHERQQGDWGLPSTLREHRDVAVEAKRASAMGAHDVHARRPRQQNNKQVASVDMVSVGHDLGYFQAESANGPKMKFVVLMMLYNFHLGCKLISGMD